MSTLLLIRILLICVGMTLIIVGLSINAQPNTETPPKLLPASASPARLTTTKSRKLPKNEVPKYQVVGYIGELPVYSSLDSDKRVVLFYFPGEERVNLFRYD